MGNRNISDNELLEELSNRVEAGKIVSIPTYSYETDKISFKFKTADVIHSFTSDLNIEKQFRYYQNYRTFCLPLVEEKQKTELNQKLEMFLLKIKTNYDRN